MNATRAMVVWSDLMCVLTAFFVIAAATRVEGVGVDLDLVATGGGGGLVRPNAPHVLLVAPDGTVTFDGEPVEPATLGAALPADGRSVLVYTELPEALSQALGALYDAGALVHLGVRPTHAPPEPED